MSAGQFATARRGGLTLAEVRKIEQARRAPRPTSWQTLSNILGHPVSRLQEAMAAPCVPCPRKPS